MEPHNQPIPQGMTYIKERNQKRIARCKSCGDSMLVASGSTIHTFMDGVRLGQRTKNDQIRHWHRECRTLGRKLERKAHQ